MENVWNSVIMQPMLNSLLALAGLLFNNFGLAIIVLTVVVRMALFPLTQKQTKSTKALQELQPKIQQLQKKYARDQKTMQKELSGLYKEAGINPLGCVWPMLIQFPIWIGLYQSIVQALGASPEYLLNLSQLLYNWPLVLNSVPAQQSFLWLNLAEPDGTMLLAILVGLSMWVQQKMVTPPPMDPKQRQMNQITTLMLPLVFGFFTLQFPSGLALYWVVSNIIGIAIQYFTSGWGYLRPAPATAVATTQKPS
jgi:YidC/Oxa1 family membrane protein insertase